MKIPSNVANLFDNTPLVAFATADKAGMPNVVCVLWKKISSDGNILLLDNYMNTTRANVKDNPNVCVSFWNIETEEAYKVKGTAIYHTSGPVFDEGKAFIQSKKPGRVPKGVIEITATKIYSITPGPEAGKQIA